MITITKNPSNSWKTTFYNILAIGEKECEEIEIMLNRGISSMTDSDEEFELKI
jgi:hypothetical protein